MKPLLRLPGAAKPFVLQSEDAARQLEERLQARNTNQPWTTASVETSDGRNLATLRIAPGDLRWWLIEYD